jgi:hypothetical protein
MPDESPVLLGLPTTKLVPSIFLGFLIVTACSFLALKFLEVDFQGRHFPFCLAEDLLVCLEGG